MQGAKRKSTHGWMLLLGVGDGIASKQTKPSMRKVGMTKPAPAASVHLALLALDDTLISVADT